MRGLIKATAYYNNLEAMKDWEFVRDIATKNGLSQLAEKHTPKPSYGYRRIDRCIAGLREDLQAAGINVPRRCDVVVTDGS